MKKRVLQLIIFIIMVAICTIPLTAQENKTADEVTPANEEQPSEQKKEEPAEEKKPEPDKKTRGVYTIGEVIVKGPRHRQR